eukprot:9467508-Lingulodinium_polyedra.AAC.1
MCRGVNAEEQARLKGRCWRGPTVLARELAAAEGALRAEQSRAKEDRGQRWYRWVQDAMAGGGGRLHRWIKAGAPAVPTLVHDPDDPEEAVGG